MSRAIILNCDYSWTKEFMEAGKERFARDAVRDANQQEVQQLQRLRRAASDCLMPRVLRATRPSATWGDDTENISRLKSAVPAYAIRLSTFALTA